MPCAKSQLICSERWTGLLIYFVTWRIHSKSYALRRFRGQNYVKRNWRTKDKVGNFYSSTLCHGIRVHVCILDKSNNSHAPTRQVKRKLGVEFAICISCPVMGVLISCFPWPWVFNLVVHLGTEWFLTLLPPLKAAILRRPHARLGLNKK